MTTLEDRLAEFATASLVPPDLAARMGDAVAGFVAGRRDGVVVGPDVRALTEPLTMAVPGARSTSLLGRLLPDGWAAWSNVVLTGGSDHPVALAALAAAEAESCDARTWATAVARGAEVARRVRQALEADTERRAFDPEVAGGFIGAVVSVVSLTGLSGAAVSQAIGTVGMQASGLLAGRAVSLTSSLAAAWAAKAGIDSVRLVQHGFIGPVDGLSGPTGLFAMYRCPDAPRAIVDSLGTEWLIDDAPRADPDVPVDVVAEYSRLT